MVNAKNNSNKKGSVIAKEKESINNQQSEFTNTSTKRYRGTQRICSSLYLFPIGILLAGKILGVLMSWLGNFLLLEALAGNY